MNQGYAEHAGFLMAQRGELKQIAFLLEVRVQATSDGKNPSVCKVLSANY